MVRHDPTLRAGPIVASSYEGTSAAGFDAVLLELLLRHPIARAQPVH